LAIAQALFSHHQPNIKQHYNVHTAIILAFALQPYLEEEALESAPVKYCSFIFMADNLLILSSHVPLIGLQTTRRKNKKKKHKTF
jgi:hypothetical protein